MEHRAKLALAAIVGFAGAAIVLIVIAVVALVHSKTLTRDLLSLASAQTGCRIGARRLALHFAASGIELAASNLSVECRGDVADSRQVSATVGYGALFGLHPLPLDDVVLVQPRARLAPSRSKFSWSKTTTQPVAFARIIGGLARSVVISDGQIAFADASGQPAQASQVEVDGRIGTSTGMVRAWISRLSWRAASQGELGLSGRIWIATSRNSRMPVRAALRMTTTAHTIATQATLNLALNAAGILHGTAVIQANQLPTVGQAGFDGSFLLSQQLMEIGGKISTSADFAMTRSFPVSLTLGSPFSPNPQLSASVGALGLRLAALFEAMGSTNGPATGTVSFNSVRLATSVGSWRDALAQCSDATCRNRQALRMLLEQTQLSIALASANLNLATAPPGLRMLQVEHEVDFTLGRGVLASKDVSAQIGALQIANGLLRIAASVGADGIPSRLEYQAAFPLTLQVAQLDLSHLPPSARHLLASGALLYARARASGKVAMRNRQPQPRAVDLQLSEGLLRLQNRALPRTVFFHGRAHLSNRKLRARARVLFSDGGTLALDSTLALPDRRLRARIGLSHVDLQRWSAVMVQAGMPQGFRVTGQARGQLTLRWHPSGHPLVEGSMDATALNVASPFSNGPVMVRQTRIILQDNRANAILDGITMGRGAFNLRADLSNFAHPAIRLALRGERLDLNAIDVAGIRKSAHGSSSSAKPISLSAQVDLQTVLLHGTKLRNVTGELGNQGDVWRVRKLTGSTLDGSFLVAGTWQSQAHFLHLIGGVHRIEARQLFPLVGDTANGRSPVSGQLSARVNAGLLLANGQPRLSCGGATIAISNGTLGKADLLARVMEVMSLENWLKFRPPDLERSGLPFRKITARLAFSPDVLTVEHVQLAGSVIRLAGHGSVKLPDNVLDLHLAVLPFTTAHWVLEQLPLLGPRLATSYDRVFAAHLKVSGPPDALSVSPQLLRTTTSALVGVLELPVDFVPEVTLPDAASLTLPPPTSTDWPDCAPPWNAKPAPGSDSGTANRSTS